MLELLGVIKKRGISAGAWAKARAKRWVNTDLLYDQWEKE